MPRISYFYGISIQMFFDDHRPAHIHAKYNGSKRVSISRRGRCFPGNCRCPQRAWCRTGSRSAAPNWPPIGPGWKRAGEHDPVSGPRCGGNFTVFEHDPVSGPRCGGNFTVFWISAGLSP
ncbi:MAG: DUF4160 domain-containing protein, partial [Hyphomonadaceae bacterium]|nr:DUF4160 domain-containing protein [Hyphomonadaceae bacterium]